MFQLVLFITTRNAQQPIGICGLRLITENVIVKIVQIKFIGQLDLCGQLSQLVFIGQLFGHGFACSFCLIHSDFLLRPADPGVLLFLEYHDRPFSPSGFLSF